MTTEPTATGSVSGETPSTEPVKPTRERKPIGAVTLIIAALFGLVYAFLVYQALGNLILVPQVFAAHGLGGDRVPWWLLIAGLLIPIAVYVLAFLIGLRRGLRAKAVLFITGLAASAALGFTVVAVFHLTADPLLAALASVAN